MFEKVLVRRHSVGDKPIDMGLLIEALIFYGQVHILFDGGSLKSLLSEFGADPLMDLIDNNFITTTYICDQLGTRTFDHGGIRYYDFASFEVVGHKEKKYNRKEVVGNIFSDTLGKNRNTKRAIDKFLSKTKIRSISDGVNHPQGISGLARQDIEDVSYVDKAVRNSLEQGFPGFRVPTDWYFRPFRINDGFVIDTNYDMARIKRETELISGHSIDFTEAYIVEYLHQATSDLTLAGQYMSELITSPVSSAIMKTKINNILYRREAHQSNLDAFQEDIVGRTHAIRNAINNKEISIKDAISLVEQSQKFKKWLQAVHPDSRLIQEYYKEATKGSWVEKLPNKSVRFGMITSAGLTLDAFIPTGLGTMAGIALGAADTFILDKIFRGWRPNQYIDETLKPMVNP